MNINDRFKKVNKKAFSKSRGQWCRMYASDLNDLRLMKLPPKLYRAWSLLCKLACENNGILPDNENIIFRLRYDETELDSIVNSLIDVGLLHVDIGNPTRPTLRMSDWGDRQYASDRSTSRVRKFRAQKNDETFQSRNVKRFMKRVKRTSTSANPVPEHKLTTPAGKITGPKKTYARVRWDKLRQANAGQDTPSQGKASPGHDKARLGDGLAQGNGKAGHRLGYRGRA